MLNLDNLTLYLGHFYTKTSFLCLSLCCQRALCIIQNYNIIFNMGMTPPPTFEQCKKKLHFSLVMASLKFAVNIWMQSTKIVPKFKSDVEMINAMNDINFCKSKS